MQPLLCTLYVIPIPHVPCGTNGRTPVTGAPAKIPCPPVLMLIDYDHGTALQHASLTILRQKTLCWNRCQESGTMGPSIGRLKFFCNKKMLNSFILPKTITFTCRTSSRS